MCPITWRPTLPFNFSLRKWGAVLGNILLPNTCYGCKRDLSWQEKSPLCPDCVKQLQGVGPLYCVRCGKPLPDGGAHCYDCRGHKEKTYTCKIIRSAYVFQDPLRALIHAFKYAGQDHLASYLAQLMYAQWRNYPVLHEAQLLLPVPLYKKKYTQRGYNQSALLARELGYFVQKPVDLTSLVRMRHTPSQTKLGRQARFANMKNAFLCVQPSAVKGRKVLLIDDVATTGATLEACAHALRAAGAKKVMAYTLAREI